MDASGVTADESGPTAAEDAAAVVASPTATAAEAKTTVDSFEFVRLSAGPEEINKDDGNEGFVEFEVTLRAKEDEDNPVAGQETLISERSRFLRNPKDGSWSYASGDVRSNVAGLEDTTLNV